MLLLLVLAICRSQKYALLFFVLCAHIFAGSELELSQRRRRRRLRCLAQFVSPFFANFIIHKAGGARARRNANGDVDDAANALTRFACVRWPQSFYSRPELNIVIKFMLFCYRYIYKIYTNGRRVLFANLSIRSALPSTRLASPRLNELQ